MCLSSKGTQREKDSAAIEVSCHHFSPCEASTGGFAKEKNAEMSRELEKLGASVHVTVGFFWAFFLLFLSLKITGGFC